MCFQVFLIYAALVCFVYLATDGFQNNAPFVFTLPVVVLGWFTLWTRMPKQTRLCTAISFFTLALALYSWSEFPKKMELSAMLICFSHIAYLLSFYRSLRKWWIALALFTTVAVSLFLYGVFADLYRSIPALVVAMAATILLSTCTFIVAGSVWKNGSTMAYEEQSALVRFFGTFFLLICNAALLINLFTRHTTTLVCYLNFTYYMSQFLLYFANERAF